MNTRGVMELVALNIGLDAGVISTGIYSMMVLMALFTTLMTGPIVALLFRPGLASTAAPSVPFGSHNPPDNTAGLGLASAPARTDRA